LISKAVKDANKLSIGEMEVILKEEKPELFEKKEKVERELPELPGAVKGKVVTRLAPEPNGYLHIGHAVSFFFNHYYAQKYSGKLILRFEDTNPEKERTEYYEAIKEDLAWLGIKYDKVKRNSDDIDLFYKHAEALINSGDAYVCVCPVEKSRKLRYDGKNCPCRRISPEKSDKLFTEMKTTLKPGSASLRLKLDMKSKNTTFRDPTIMRIVEAEHPLQGNKYRVWPLYDFANAIEDAKCGVTHVLRSNEFQQRNKLQNKIRELLGMDNPHIISYSRINLEGTPTSKREIQKLIDNGKVSGWDDPRLATLKAIKRRGIVPETLERLAKEVRMTSGSTTISIDALNTINRKILSPKTKHYFFVPSPEKIEVKSKGTFYIPKADAKSMKKGEIFRLKDLFNVKLTTKGKAEFDSDEVKADTKKLQWVDTDAVDTELLISETGKTIKGLAQKEVSKLKLGEIVQFERVGFARVESSDKPIKFIFTHE
ncbi:MAG: glutamate--tRNA ligase family protein, partial [archaeon]|nr:glutamate--tRNA ligase family protein [archaeon]